MCKVLSRFLFTYYIFYNERNILSFSKDIVEKGGGAAANV